MTNLNPDTPGSETRTELPVAINHIPLATYFEYLKLPNFYTVQLKVPGALVEDLERFPARTNHAGEINIPISRAANNTLELKRGVG